jgi:transposase
VEIVVAPEEVPLLLGYKKSNAALLVRLKAEAVLLASHGVDVGVIAQVTDREVRTISEWLRAWRRTRMASVVCGHVGNENAAKLTVEQKHQVAAVLASSPAAVGLPAEFWDVPTLKQWVRTRFEVVYESDSSYHLLLEFSGLSFKKPDVFDRRRDEAKITERMGEIRAEIAPLLADEAWEVFAADEVRLEHEAEIRRAWLPVGQRTVVKVDRDRVAQSWLGALNQRTGRCELFAMGWQNTDNVIEALTSLVARYPGKKLAIVWDNARFHRSKQLRAHLGEGNRFADVHLIALPPYAPDENPIEHVWNTTKAAVANIQRTTPEETFTEFETYIDSRAFDYTFTKKKNADFV